MVWFARTKLRQRLTRPWLSPCNPSALGLVVGTAVLFVGACSSEATTTPGSFSQTPAAVKRSEQRQFEIALYSSPTDVPVRGENHVRLELSHETDGGLAITPTLVTFMPAMGHGSGVTPELTEIEGPYYTFEDVVLNMPGRWELRLELQTEGLDGSTAVDHAVFEFDVD
jgi:hypothetical protein